MLRKLGPLALVPVVVGLAVASFHYSFVHRPRPVAAALPAAHTPISAAPAGPATLVLHAGGDRAVSGGGSETLVHAARKGETVDGLVRKFWPQSQYMTHAEFAAALRDANGALKGEFLKPGALLTVPGIEPQPIVERPVIVPHDYEVRAIYLTGTMAGSARGLKLIQEWRQQGGNAVVFDVKDSDGSVNVPFGNPLAPKRRPAIPNLPKFVRWLHRQHLHVIARIAVFRDEMLVAQHPELAVKSRRSGRPWLENGKLVWTDPSLPAVQDYNLALARAAAGAGVDEVQFDYVRFPAESDQKDAAFSYQSAHPDWTRADVMAGFLARAQSELRAMHVLFSLDVFGVMAWQRPIDLLHTGQDIVRMAKLCDVLSPMIYPSHFFGMEGIARPGDAPAHFIAESMDRFRKITAGSGVVLRPWLQAFAWRTTTYSPAYILTQVETANQHGGDGFLFWNARNDYATPFRAMAGINAAPAKYSRAGRRMAAALPPR